LGGGKKKPRLRLEKGGGVKKEGEKDGFFRTRSDHTEDLDVDAQRKKKQTKNGKKGEHSLTQEARGKASINPPGGVSFRGLQLENETTGSYERKRIEKIFHSEFGPAEKMGVSFQRRQ